MNTLHRVYFYLIVTPIGIFKRLVGKQRIKFDYESELKSYRTSTPKRQNNGEESGADDNYPMW